MIPLGAERIRNEVILIARILLVRGVSHTAG